jgi:hypothetical protein
VLSLANLKASLAGSTKTPTNPAARLPRSMPCEEPEKMFEWLEHAWTTHDAGVIQLLYQPFGLAYKDDPRFIAFAQKIGVMPKGGANP